MARCIEDVTRRRPGWGATTGSCTNPGEFAIRRNYEDRALNVCRTHLPVLVKRLLLDGRHGKRPQLQVALVIHEEANGDG